jgi:hypothetical protein
VRGATKIYRRECWSAIGGLSRQVGWDTLDEVHANYLGWTTRSFFDVSLIQQRFTGDAAGQWRNWVKNGYASYLIGYHSLFVIARAGSRLFRRPYLVATLGILWGFFRAKLKGLPLIADENLVLYVRRQQVDRLLGRQSMWR